MELILILSLVVAGWFVLVGLPLLVIYCALKNWMKARYDEWQTAIRAELKANIKVQKEEPIQSGTPAAKYCDFDTTYRKLELPPLAITPTKPPFPDEVTSIPLADLPKEPSSIVVKEHQPTCYSSQEEISSPKATTSPVSIEETSGLPIFAEPDPLVVSSAITSTVPVISDDTYRIQGEKELPSQVALEENAFVDWKYEPTPYRQEQKPKQTTDNILKNLELQIGRKVMGWVAVALFVLAGAFFVQLAASQGWLNPTNRFYGMFATGLALLVGGIYFFRKGWRRYSEMVNSAGIITLLSAAWYAQKIAMYSSGVTFALLIATVVGGLLSAGIYRSQVTSLVATLGGLCIPLLVSHTYWPLIIWLLVLNFSVIILVNLLERSTTAGLCWVGSLFLMFGQGHLCPGNILGLKLTVGLFAGFAILHYVDLLTVAFRPTRRLGTNDFWRALLTPLILLYVFHRIFHSGYFGDATFFGWAPVDFFERYDSWFTLFIVLVMGGTAWLIARADRLIKYLRPHDDTMNLLPNRNRSLVTVCLILMFCFMAMFILFTFNASWYSTGFLAISCGLLYAAGKSFRLFYLSRLPNDTKNERPMPQNGYDSDRHERTLFLVWSLIYSIPGVLLLLFQDFFPHFVPTEAFENGASCFVHRLALPVLIDSLILMGTMGLVVWSKKRKTAVDSLENTQSRFIVSAIYAVVGFVTFWGLLSSEIYACVTVRHMADGLDMARLAGWGSVLFAWLGWGLFLFLIGTCFHSLVIRTASLVVLIMTLFKMTLVDIEYHPVFQLIGVSSNSVEHIRSDVFSLTGVTLPQYTIPIFNHYSLPLLIVIITLLLMGIVMRYKAVYRRNETEYGMGLVIGLWSTVLLWLMGSLETVACFEFGGLTQCVHYYAIFGLIYFWTLWAIILLVTGLAAQSRPVRVLAYVLLFFEIPIVMYCAFCHDFKILQIAARWPVLNYSGISILLFALLLIGIGLGICRRIREMVQTEKYVAAILGSIGVVIIWLLFSFEVWRYCTGREWLGPNEWTRMIALSILWGFIIFIVILLERSRESLLLRAIIFTLSLILGGKVVMFEMAFRGQFPQVFMNPYGLECFLSSLYLIGVAIHFSSRATARLASLDVPAPRARIEKIAWRLMLITGVIMMWLSSSIDLFNAVRNFFPDSGKLTAQMSLSILWSCFAGLLLAIGFWRKSKLARWLAICLFGMTTLKVLTVDFAYVGQVGRFAAYLTLAIVLAIAAAAYQRFRG